MTEQSSLRSEEPEIAITNFIVLIYFIAYDRNLLCNLTGMEILKCKSDTEPAIKCGMDIH